VYGVWIFFFFPSFTCEQRKHRTCNEFCRARVSCRLQYIRTCCRLFYMLYPLCRCRGVERQTTLESRCYLQHGPQICSRQHQLIRHAAACFSTVFLSVSRPSRLNSFIVVDFPFSVTREILSDSTYPSYTFL
jgi:hypothetical protein